MEERRRDYREDERRLSKVNPHLVAAPKSNSESFRFKNNRTMFAARSFLNGKYGRRTR